MWIEPNEQHEKTDEPNEPTLWFHVWQGLNSHYFHIIGDGHQPNSRGLYTHYKDSVIKGGRSPIPNKTRQP